MILYCTPTYKSFDLCCASIDAAMFGSLKPDKIIVIDNSPDSSGSNYLLKSGLLSKYNNIEIVAQGKNLGVAKSWNIFMEYGAEYTIIANDDVKVQEHTIQSLVDASAQYPDEIFFSGNNNNNTFSFFMLTQKGYELVGKFDEMFWPAYFEDNDYGYRMKLLGYVPFVVPGASYDHVGSSTIARYSPEELSQHHKRFRSNEDYFRYKWGGTPTQEKYTEPFKRIGNA